MSPSSVPEASVSVTPVTVVCGLATRCVLTGTQGRPHVPTANGGSTSPGRACEGTSPSLLRGHCRRLRRGETPPASDLKAPHAPSPGRTRRGRGLGPPSARPHTASATWPKAPRPPGPPVLHPWLPVPDHPRPPGLSGPSAQPRQLPSVETLRQGAGARAGGRCAWGSARAEPRCSEHQGPGHGGALATPCSAREPPGRGARPEQGGCPREPLRPCSLGPLLPPHVRPADLLHQGRWAPPGPQDVGVRSPESLGER